MKDERILDMLNQDAAAGLEDDPGPEYWDDFAGRVRTRVALDQQQARRRSWWRPVFGLATSVMGLVALTLWLSPPTVTTHPTTDYELDVIEDVFDEDYMDELTEMNTDELNELLVDLETMRRSS